MGARELGLPLGEPRPEGKIPFGRNPSPDVTYLPYVSLFQLLLLSRGRRILQTGEKDIEPFTF